MSMFRRRLMIAAALEQQGGGGIGYIKDGLVFHLDGINKGDDDTVWTDLIRGVKFTYKNCKLNKNNVQFEDNSYATDGDLSYDVNLSTIEVVYDCELNTSQQVIIIPATKGIGFGFFKNQIYYSSGIQKPMFVTDSGKHTTSVNDLMCISDKKNLEAKSSFQMNARRDATLGIRREMNGAISYPFKGKIYSIRIYNRQLSEQEMLHNQKIDIDRFFDGHNPSDYIKFEDSEVERICIENFSSDKVGVTYNDAAKVTSIGRLFKNATRFNEFQYFIECTELPNSFEDALNLKTIRLSKNLKNFKNSTFWNAKVLESINLENIETMGNDTMRNTTAFKVALNMPNLKSIGNRDFMASGITAVENLGSVETIPISCFEGCKNLKYAILPESLKEIGDYAFASCYNMKAIIIKAKNPPKILYTRFRPWSLNVYVPDEVVNAYKTAPVWSEMIDYIKPLSECKP